MLPEDQTHNEKILLSQVAEGNQEAFTLLFNRYYPLLFSYIQRITRSEPETESILQDVFMKIWMGREALLYVDNFRPWLWVMARHKALNAMRDFVRRQSAQAGLASVLTVAQTTEDELAARERHLTLIDEAVDQLPAHCRQVWLMNRRDKLKQVAIAENMGISLPTVKKYMRQAVIAIMDYVRDRSSLGATIFALLSAFLEKK